MATRTSRSASRHSDLDVALPDGTRDEDVPRGTWTPRFARCSGGFNPAFIIYPRRRRCARGRSPWQAGAVERRHARTRRRVFELRRATRRADRGAMAGGYGRDIDDSRSTCTAIPCARRSTRGADVRRRPGCRWPPACREAGRHAPGRPRGSRHALRLRAALEHGLHRGEVRGTHRAAADFPALPLRRRHRRAAADRRGSHGAPWPRTPRAWRDIALVGVLLQATYLGGVWVAIALGMPAGVSSLLVGTQPLFTALFAFNRRRARRRGCSGLGLLLGFAGIALVLSDRLTLAGVGPLALAANLLALVGITAARCTRSAWRRGRPAHRQPHPVRCLVRRACCPLRWRSSRMPVDFTLEFWCALAWSVLALVACRRSRCCWL